MEDLKLTQGELSTLEEWLKHPGYAVYRKYVDSKKALIYKTWFVDEEPKRAEHNRQFVRALETFFGVCEGLLRLKTQVLGEK